MNFADGWPDGRRNMSQFEPLLALNHYFAINLSHFKNDGANNLYLR